MAAVHIPVSPGKDLMIVKRLFLLCMALLMVCVPIVGAATPDDGTIVLENPAGPAEATLPGKSPADDGAPADPEDDYYAFLKAHAAASKPLTSVSAQPVPPADTAGVNYAANVQGEPGVVLFEKDGSTAYWNITVETAGLYTIRMDYILQMENTLNARFDILVNNAYQNKSTQLLRFPRRFRNETGIQQDSRDNDRRPVKEEIKQWESWVIDDSEVETNGGLLFYLNAGVNKIAVRAVLGNVAIKGLTAVNETPRQDYDSYIQENNRKPNNAPSDYYWVREAEDCGDTSDSVLYPTYDRSSAATQPNDPAKLRLNTIGQNSWNMAGQWIEWEIEVPADGYYEIGMRVRQSELRGFFSTRKISIITDGKEEVLFRELDNVQFPYNLNWYVTTLGNDGNYLFYLTKGKHTLRMEAAQGAVAESVSELEKLTLELNTLYRNVIMVTGLTVDIYRDYMLEQQIPDLISRLTDIRNRLQVQMKELASIGVKGGSDAVVIDKLIYQIDSFIKNPRTMPSRMEDFLSNISSMSSWALSMINQPLEIDYIYVKSPGVKEPKAGAGFWKQLGFRIEALAASFVEDYSDIAGTGETGNITETIDVWVALGRDQGQIIKDLSENTFTPNTGIAIRLSLMQTGLNEAIAAGRGPDVALFTGDVVNLASREALANITKYENYEDVIKRFNPNALTPYRYKSGLYALPLEQNVQMMYYRTDIFEELGLEPPKTWEDFDHVLTILQKNRLTVGLYAGTSTAGDISIFEMLLYQSGGSLFNEDLSATILDDEKCYKAFKKWTDYYVKYGLLTEFNFYNRFRSGEMPLGIQPQNMYATLRLAAPELDGLWEMVPVPQTVLSGGSISNVAVGSVTPAIVLKNDKEDACFRYIDWFTSTETQVSYGQEVENILGLGARYNSANLEAIKKLNWTVEESELLLSQMEKTYITPAIPASYYINRNLTNAFRKVIINGYTPRESLLSYNKIINSEITRKNNELERRAAKSKERG